MIPYFLTLALALGSSLVIAQAPTPRPGGAAASDWQLRAGAVLIAMPKYSGGRELRTLGAPLLEARWRENYLISTVRGLVYEQRLGQGAAISLALAPDVYQRRPKDGPRLLGLDKFEMAPALRLGGEFAEGPVFLNAVASTRLGSAGKPGGRGSYAEFELGYGLLQSSELALALGVNATLMDAKLGQGLYGISAAEAGRSRLRPHAVGAGLHSVGGFVQVSYQLDAHWQLFAKASLASLRGDAADSPVVERKRQPLLALALSRSF